MTITGKVQQVMRDEETVYDENGLRSCLKMETTWSNRRRCASNATGSTAGSAQRLTRQQVQATLRELEDSCVRAANAIKLHVASPRAVLRIRNALKLWPSGSMDNDRLMNKLNGPSLRRVAPGTTTTCCARWTRMSTLTGPNPPTSPRRTSSGCSPVQHRYDIRHLAPHPPMHAIQRSEL